MNDLENVFLADMRDLMSQDSRQLGFIVDLFEEPVRDEHVSGGRCKGVNGVIFQHGKMIRNVGTIGGQSHRLADEIYITHELRLFESAAESGDHL